jgi:hypothetical protein
MPQLRHAPNGDVWNRAATVRVGRLKRPNRRVGPIGMESRSTIYKGRPMLMIVGAFVLGVVLAFCGVE